MTDVEKDFLEKNFKAGEYAQVAVLVKLGDLDTFIEHLRKSNLTLAIVPSVQTEVDFLSDTNDPGSQVVS